MPTKWIGLRRFEALRRGMSSIRVYYIEDLLSRDERERTVDDLSFLRVSHCCHYLSSNMVELLWNGVDGVRG